MCSLSWRETSTRTCSPETSWTTCSIIKSKSQRNTRLLSEGAVCTYLQRGNALLASEKWNFSEGICCIQEWACLCQWCYTCAVCRVENAVEKVAADLDAAVSQPGKKNQSVSKVKQKARTCLQEMVANISPAFIR